MNPVKKKKKKKKKKREGKYSSTRRQQQLGTNQQRWQLGTTTEKRNRKMSDPKIFWCNEDSRSAFHTALLHLKSEPKAICYTRSPLTTRPFTFMDPSSYQSEPLDVCPKQCSVNRNGSMSYSLSPAPRELLHGNVVGEGEN